MKSKWKSVFIGAVIAVCVTANAPSAFAGPTTDPDPDQIMLTPSISPLPTDGYFRAWTGTYRSGTLCSWAGNAPTWGTCSNNVESVENDGYAGSLSAVNMYWGGSYTGAWACLGRGNLWMDLTAGQQTFSHGSGLAGYGQNPSNNIASSKWVSAC